MKVQQLVCDECKKVKDEKNGWLKIGVMRLESLTTQLTLGNVPEKEMPNFEVHDLCTPACFHAHIDHLLGVKYVVTPPPLPIEPAPEEFKSI